MNVRNRGLGETGVEKTPNRYILYTRDDSRLLEDWSWTFRLRYVCRFPSFVLRAVDTLNDS